MVFVASQMGHRKPTVTLDVYAHLFDARDHADKLAATLEANSRRFSNQASTEGPWRSAPDQAFPNPLPRRAAAQRTRLPSENRKPCASRVSSGPPEARPADGLAIDFVVLPDRAQLGEIVQPVRDGRLRTNIGNVATLDDAVAAFNPTERISGQTIIRVRP